jgi:hypothetical protein
VDKKMPALLEALSARGVEFETAAPPAVSPGAAMTAPVAVLIIGLLREFLQPKVWQSQHFLLQPLLQEFEVRSRL